MGSPNLGPPTFLLEGRSPRVQVPLWKRRQLQAGEPSCTWVSPSPALCHSQPESRARC